MQIKHLREIIDNLSKADPRMEDAEVKINLGHSLDELTGIHHFIEKSLVVLFPVSVPSGYRRPTREEWEQMKKQEEEGRQ